MMSDGRVAEHRETVVPEWLDSNGHMNLAFYVVVFDRGTDAWMDLAGLSAAYRAEAGHTVFAVEAHTLYRQELRLGAPDAGADLVGRRGPKADASGA